jgi:hypothetical protein
VQLAALTGSPRRYGLHATLKAPFALREGIDAGTLQSRLAAFCQARAAFELPSLGVARLSEFLALRPTAASAALQALADACVDEFDDVRAPLPEEEVTRRRAAGLTPRQAALLQQYGYPYVFDEYRFHLTLTEPVDDVTARGIVPWLTDYFAEALREPTRVRAVCLFVEPAPGADFRLVRRFTFPQ